MHDIEISIIVPVYNVENYIVECLNSVINQTNLNYECIIVDDCGYDNSIELAYETIFGHSNKINEDTNKKFKIIHRTENGGLSAARNSGLAEAKGDYVLFLDADDKLMPNAVESFIHRIEQIQANEGVVVDIVLGNMTTDKGNVKYYFPDNKYPIFSNDNVWIRRSMLTKHFPITAWNKCYNRMFLHKNNLKFAEGVIHEDVKWSWDISKVISNYAVNNTITYWQRIENNSSIMHSKDLTKSYKSILSIAEKCTLNIVDKLDVAFVSDLLSYHRRNSVWEQVDKKEIKGYLKNLYHNLSRLRTNRFILNDFCILLYVPVFLTKSNLFSKLYYEYKKRNGILL